jgi:hypothetical protein
MGPPPNKKHPPSSSSIRTLELIAYNEEILRIAVISRRQFPMSYSFCMIAFHNKLSDNQA